MERFATSAVLNQSKCSNATAVIASEHRAACFLAWWWCRHNHSSCLEVHCIISLSTRPEVSKNLAFVLSAALEYREEKMPEEYRQLSESMHRVWMTQVGFVRDSTFSPWARNRGTM